MAEGDGEGNGEGTGGEGDGGESRSWLGDVPEYAQDWEEISSAKSADDLWQWVDNLRSFRGRAIALPGEDASDEQRAEIASKLLERMPDLVMRPRNDEERQALMRSLGAPEEAAAYSLDVEGFEPDADRMEAIRRHAHAAGIPQDMFESFVGAMAKDEVAAAQAQAQTRQDEIAELRQEWGAAYDQKVEGVRNFLTRMQAPPAFLNAEKSGLFDAADYKWLSDLSARIGGGEGSPGAGLGGEPQKFTPAEAQAKIDEIRSNPKHPFNDTSADPAARQRAMDEVLELHRQLPGGRRPVVTQSYGEEITL